MPTMNQTTYTSGLAVEPGPWQDGLVSNENTTTTTPDTTTLRMPVRALNVLRGVNGWDFPEDPHGSQTVVYEVHGDGTHLATVTIVTKECQSIDLLEAAEHCVNRLAGLPDTIELLVQDGSVDL